MTQLTSKRRRLSGLHYAKLLKLLYERGGTCRQLAEETGFTDNTIRDYIRELRRQHLVYIASYETDWRARACAPSYAFGPGVADAEKPKALTGAQRQQQYRERQLTKRMYFRPSTTENP